MPATHPTSRYTDSAKRYLQSNRSIIVFPNNPACIHIYMGTSNLDTFPSHIRRTFIPLAQMSESIGPEVGGFRMSGGYYRVDWPVTCNLTQHVPS